MTEPSKIERIRALAPTLYRMREEAIAGFRREPSAYVLPKQLDPGRYEGPDASDSPAMILGRPIIWSDDDRVGIFIETPDFRRSADGAAPHQAPSPSTEEINMKRFIIAALLVVASIGLTAAPSDAGNPRRTGWVEVIKCDLVPLHPGGPPIKLVNCHSVWVHPGKGLHPEAKS